MKANQLATLVLRVMGIYCLVQSISTVYLIGVVFGVRTAHDLTPGDLILVAIAPVAIIITYLIIGILLIVYSVPWGHKLISQAAGEENVFAISFHQAQILTFTALGILIFAGTLPNVLPSIFYLLQSFSPDNILFIKLSGEANTRSITYAIGTLLKSALGLWLFFGADGFANLFGFLRNFGTPKPPPAA